MKSIDNTGFRRKGRLGNCGVRCTPVFDQGSGCGNRNGRGMCAGQGRIGHVEHHCSRGDNGRNMANSSDADFSYSSASIERLQAMIESMQKRLNQMTGTK